MKCNVATKSTVVLTKEETKVKKICEFFDCRKICTYEDFVMALECGEYVIGGTLVPFNPQYVFHYDEGRFDVFEVEPSMKILGCVIKYRNIPNTHDNSNERRLIPYDIKEPSNNRL